MYKKRFISAALAAMMIMSTLSGCSGGIVGTDARSYPLSAALTQQEVLDYYAASMDYDTVVSRSAEADINNYETTEVTSGAKVDAVETALETTIGYLKSDNYVANASTSKMLTTEMYNYIRAMLNDKTLSNPKRVALNQALGYYFADVEFDVGPATIGTFKPTISLIGISGGYVRSSLTGEDSVDDAFLATAQDALNDYFEREGMEATANFNIGASTFSITGVDSGTTSGVDFSDSTIGESAIGDISSGSTTVSGEVPAPNSEPPENTEEPTEESTEGTAEEPTDSTTDDEATSGEEGAIGDIGDATSGGVAVDIPTQNETRPVVRYTARTSGIDLDLFKRVVGYGNNKAYIPRLDLIYNIPPQSSDAICGIGLYPSGSLGASLFGSSHDALSGKCTLRFVYKEDLTDPSILELTNIYVVYYEVDSGFSSNNDSIIPDFLSDEFSQLLERADRAMVNADISGLAGGHIFDDIGMAVLQGYLEEYGNVLRQISTVRRIVSRDIGANAYLVEIESYRQEGAAQVAGEDLYASYKDIVYATIEQKGDEFIFTDWTTVRRQLMTEPDISPDKATAKRVVALGLTGEVSEETKESATQLINDLYTASTMRLLTGPKTLDDGTVIERGMYDCFNSNVEMLSSTKKEELNSDIRQVLVKYGTTTSAEMSGIVTEWIGGSENQVEFTTEEVVTYQGHNDGVYMQCYYLVSNMEDVWVIDDIQILEQTELSGEGLNSVVSRIRG